MRAVRWWKSFPRVTILTYGGGERTPLRFHVDSLDYNRSVVLVVLIYGYGIGLEWGAAKRWTTFVWPA